MQRTRSDRRIGFWVGLCVLFIALVFVDQITKIAFKNLYFATGGKTVVIEGFFYFTFTENSGSAFSFLADAWWGQIFFKILTVIALVVFTWLLVRAVKKDKKFLAFGLVIIIGGTVGNFIDRLAFDKVRDFIGFTFGNYNFAIFNLADVFLTVGVIMLLVYYLFLDEEAVFKKKNKDEKKDNGNNPD